MQTTKDNAGRGETVFKTRIFCRKNTPTESNNSVTQQAKSNKNTNNRTGRKRAKSAKLLDMDVPKSEILKLGINKVVSSTSKCKEQSPSTTEVTKKPEPRPLNMNRAPGFNMGQRPPMNQSYVQAFTNGGAQEHQQISVKDNPKVSYPPSGVLPTAQQGRKTKVSDVVTSPILDTTNVVRKMSPSILPRVFKQEIMSPANMRNTFPFSRIVKEPLYPEREIKDNNNESSPLDSVHELNSILDFIAGGDGPHIKSDCPANLEEEENILSEDHRRVVVQKDCTGTGVHVHFLKPLASTTDGVLEIFSRKVFVGGLPPELSEEEIVRTFRLFGPLIMDWPRRVEGKSYRYRFVFVFFQEESSVRRLVEACIKDFGKYFLSYSKSSGEYITLQVNPWRLSDKLYIQNATVPVDPRKTTLVGGVPRTIKAVELASIMDKLYAGVSCVRIDVDEMYGYPKGIAFVSFSNQESYVNALSVRFLQIRYEGLEKRVEVKHCVVDNQQCDICKGERCEGKMAPFFCASLACLKYYCRECWVSNHSQTGGDLHKPLVKEGFGPQLIPWRR